VVIRPAYFAQPIHPAYKTRPNRQAYLPNPSIRPSHRNSLPMLTCPICNKSNLWANNDSLKRHIKGHNILLCPWCTRKFTRKNRLNAYFPTSFLKLTRSHINEQHPDHPHHPPHPPQLFQNYLKCSQCEKVSGPRPSCASCIPNSARDCALKHLMEKLWDIYQILHPVSFVVLFRASQGEGDDSRHLRRIFDALASLGALYRGDHDTSEKCYLSALEGLSGSENPSLESFITYSILVYSSSIST
jgi:hypothetical protein